MSAIVFSLLVAAAAEAGIGGEVRLPLRDYVALVEKAETAEREREAGRRAQQPGQAELVSQHASLTWEPDGVAVVTRFGVVAPSAASRPVSLPVTGVAWKASVEPPGAASLSLGDGGLLAFSPAAGRFQVTVWSRAQAGVDDGVGRLEVAPLTAPVGDAEVSLPAGWTFRCRRASIAEDAVKDGRRRIRVGLPRGETVAFETHPDVAGGEEERPLAATVVVTAVDLGVDGPVRQDIVLYEVGRGALAAFDLTLPAGLEIETLSTDAEEADWVLEAGRLHVQRQARLTGAGYLALVSRPTGSSRLALQPVEPSMGVRARYLAASLQVAATVQPIPSGSWQRVDVADLPDTLEDVSGWQPPLAAWRLTGPEETAALELLPRPPVARLGTLVSERESLSLLTTEGTLLHRDVFVVTTRDSTFPLRLPEGATLWSVRVDDTPVRPVERSGATVVPLGLGGGEGDRIEVVAVQERQVPRGRSRLEVSLPVTTAPVLKHTWRLMLPKDHRYRFVSGTLSPATATGSRPSPYLAPSDVPLKPATVTRGPGGSAGILGRVVDSMNGVLPGASVVLVDPRRGAEWQTRADSNGVFGFTALRPGTYKLSVSMQGFKTAEYTRIQLRSKQTPAYAITLEVAEMTESISVVAAPPSLFGDLEEDLSAEFEEQASILKQGLVGGVRPIPVQIPESGKVLLLAGALPPERIAVEVDLK